MDNDVPFSVFSFFSPLSIVFFVVPPSFIVWPSVSGPRTQAPSEFTFTVTQSINFFFIFALIFFLFFFKINSNQHVLLVSLVMHKRTKKIFQQPKKETEKKNTHKRKHLNLSDFSSTETSLDTSSQQDRYASFLLLASFFLLDIYPTMLQCVVFATFTQNIVDIVYLGKVFAINDSDLFILIFNQLKTLSIYVDNRFWLF